MNTTKSIMVIMLVVALFCVSPIVTATDYALVEKTAENVLSSDDIGLLVPIVKISSKEVSISYIGTSTTTSEIAGDIGACIGIYTAVVLYYPEVGDLSINIQDINGKTIGTLICEKEWAMGADIENTAEMQRLALKVLLTLKTV